MHKNVRLLYLLNLLCGIVFWYPIEKLFLQEIGVTPFGVTVSAAVFLMVLILFDVPSGILADKWRRKQTLQLAIVCFIGACIAGGLSQGLVQYQLANILLGGFVVLTSGTFQAIMFDSLKDSNQQNEYDKHQGRAYALFLAGLGFSSLAGGYLADWFSFRDTYFMTVGIAVIALMASCWLTEPRSHKPVADRKLKKHVILSVQRIHASQLLMQLALLIAAMGLLRGSYTEYSGLLFITLGLTAIPTGYANAGKWLVSSLGQLIAPRIGRKALRLAPAFFIIFLVFSLVHNRWSLVCFFIAGCLYSIVANQAEAAVQDITPSDIRATTLSILSFTSNILLVPLGLLFGWVAEERNTFDAYTMIGVLGLGYMVWWFIKGRFVLHSLYASRETDGRRPTMEETLS